MFDKYLLLLKNGEIFFHEGWHFNDLILEEKKLYIILYFICYIVSVGLYLSFTSSLRLIVDIGPLNSIALGMNTLFCKNSTYLVLLSFLRYNKIEMAIA